MKLKEKVFFHKPITTSREFFQSNQGIKCVHYGDVYKNYSGKTIRSSTIINSFSNEVSKEKILYCDSIIVPDVTETISDWGHFTYIKFDGTPYINGTHTIALTSNSALELQYLFRYLSSDLNRRRLQTLLNGSTVFQISIKNFSDFYLERYQTEIQEQRHIVDILGSIDEKIENNEQLINVFENLAAKKYLDFANKTSTKIRLEDVIELFDSKRIPLSSREREQRKGIYPYYGATGVLDYVNGFLFSGEYVLFAEDGTVTDTNGHPIVQLVNGSFWVNNHAHILKGKNGWHDYTLYVALKQINVDKAVTGAVQPKINQANLLSLEIPNLSNNNLQTINTELDVVFHKVFHLRSENKSLQELKGLYLKKFFE